MQGSPTIGIGPETSAFGHGGYGGSHGYANPARGFAVGITKNRFYDGDTTPARILATLIRLLGDFDAAQVDASKVPVRKLRLREGHGFARLQGSPEVFPDNLTGAINLAKLEQVGDPSSPLVLEPGKVMQANRGVLLIDEIGKLPRGTQNVLLQALQESIVTPAKSRETFPASFLAVTTSNLEDLDNIAKIAKYLRKIPSIPPEYLPALQQALNQVPDMLMSSSSSSMRLSARRNVVLPAPAGPMMPKISFARTSRSIPWITRSSPYETWRFSTDTFTSVDRATGVAATIASWRAGGPGRRSRPRSSPAPWR